MKILSYGLALALAAALGREARADDTVVAVAAVPSVDGATQLTVPQGHLLVDAYIGASLVSGAVFKPLSLSPDLWYGVNDKLSIGLVHSSLGETGFIGGVGQSLCLTGSDNGCGHFYNNVAADVRYGLKTGDFALAVDGGLNIRSISDPFQLQLKAGLAGRWTKDKLAVEFEPEVFIGLTKRDGDATTGAGGNKDTLAVPVSVLYSLAPKVAIQVQSGVVLPLENTSDTYSIPLSLGLHVRASDPLTLTAAFSFLDLIGGGDAAGTDLRSLTLGGSYAF